MRAEVVIASRFHNLICALRLARPTVSVGYAAKNRHLMEALGLDELLPGHRALGRRASWSARSEPLERTVDALDRPDPAGHVGVRRRGGAPARNAWPLRHWVSRRDDRVTLHLTGRDGRMARHLDRRSSSARGGAASSRPGRRGGGRPGIAARKSRLPIVMRTAPIPYRDDRKQLCPRRPEPASEGSDDSRSQRCATVQHWTGPSEASGRCGGGVDGPESRRRREQHTLGGRRTGSRRARTGLERARTTRSSRTLGTPSSAAPGAVLDGQHENRYAFGGDAPDVTIKFLTVQNFGSRGRQQQRRRGQSRLGGGLDGRVEHDPEERRRRRHARLGQPADRKLPARQRAVRVQRLPRRRREGRGPGRERDRRQQHR